MKRIISVACIAILSLTAILYSCKKPQVILNEKKSTNMKTMASIAPHGYSFLQHDLGYYHNQSLDFAFEQIKTNNLFTTISNPTDVNEVCRPLIVEYYKQICNDKGLNNSYEQLMQLLIETQSTNTNFSIHLASAIHEANLILVDNTKNSSEIKSILESNLENWLNQITDEAEEEAIISYVAVAISSSKYWETNLDKWISEFNNQTGAQIQKKNINGEDVKKADAEGAAAGAVLGGVTGTVLAGPVGTWAGIIVGGAEGSSIASLTNIVFQLFVW